MLEYSIVVDFMFEHWETYCLRILWELGNSGILMFRNCENSYTRWLKIGKIYEYDVSRLWKFGDLEVGNFKHLTTWQLEISKFEFFIVVNFGSSKICLEIWRLEISNTWQLDLTIGNFEIWISAVRKFVWRFGGWKFQTLDNWKFRNLKFSLWGISAVWKFVWRFGS